MPTINQLVRQGRVMSEKKSNSPALLKSMNSIKRVPTDTKAPQKRLTFPVKATICRNTALF